MKRNLIIQTIAEDDMTEVVHWYNRQRDGLGEELLSEIDATIERVLANPRQFPSLRRKPDVRRAITHRFPIRVFFVLRDDAIIVFRVLHGAQNDRAWQTRVPQDN